MRLVSCDMIPLIDKYATVQMGIPARELISRAGAAVARTARSLVPVGSRVAVFAGGGNNGADGYAAAAELVRDMAVTVFCVFPPKPDSECAVWQNRARECGVRLEELPSDIESAISDFDLALDAVFGTGFSGEYPARVIRIAEALSVANIKTLAVDVPIGVNADTGECETFAYRCDATVMLSYAKLGAMSYPAREYIGRVEVDGIGLDVDRVHNSFSFNAFYTDASLAGELLPARSANSNKGSFGRVLEICGSPEYRGAAHLAAEAALRSGAGYVSFIGDGDLCRELRMKLPEIIYFEKTRDDIDGICSLSARAVTLIGCGCGADEELSRLVLALISTEGAPLILDADAINALSRYSSADALYAKKREIILTPHPLELARLTGISVEKINASRLSVARDFAKKYGVTLLLKGAASIICDSEKVYINSSGSSALAKAGSGDVLSGVIAALVAQRPDSSTEMCALAAYLHGAAAEQLSRELSDYGVTPSDLPIKIAKIIAGGISDAEN